MTGSDRVQRMTDEEADRWYLRLMTWIAKNHRHLANREDQWEEWKKSLPPS